MPYLGATTSSFWMSAGVTGSGGESKDFAAVAASPPYFNPKPSVSWQYLMLRSISPF